jgi:hypothetical protein
MVAWAHPEKLRRGDSSGEFISHFQDEWPGVEFRRILGAHRSSRASNTHSDLKAGAFQLLRRQGGVGRRWKYLAMATKLLIFREKFFALLWYCGGTGSHGSAERMRFSKTAYAVHIGPAILLHPYRLFNYDGPWSDIVPIFKADDPPLPSTQFIIIF